MNKPKPLFLTSLKLLLTNHLAEREHELALAKDNHGLASKEYADAKENVRLATMAIDNLGGQHYNAVIKELNRWAMETVKLRLDARERAREEGIPPEDFEFTEYMLTSHIHLIQTGLRLLSEFNAASRASRTSVRTRR